MRPKHWKQVSQGIFNVQHLNPFLLDAQETHGGVLRRSGDGRENGSAMGGYNDDGVRIFQSGYEQRNQSILQIRVKMHIRFVK